MDVDYETTKDGSFCVIDTKSSGGSYKYDGNN